MSVTCLYGVWNSLLFPALSMDAISSPWCRAKSHQIFIIVGLNLFFLTNILISKNYWAQIHFRHMGHQTNLQGERERNHAMAASSSDYAVLCCEIDFQTVSHRISEELSIHRLKSPMTAGARWMERTKGNYKKNVIKIILLLCACGCSISSEFLDGGGSCLFCVCSIISRLWGSCV